MVARWLYYGRKCLLPIWDWLVLRWYHWRFRHCSEILYIHFYIDHSLFISRIETNVSSLRKKIDKQEVPSVLYRILDFSKHSSLPKLAYDLLYRFPENEIPLYFILDNHLFCTYGKVITNDEEFVLKTCLNKVEPYIQEKSYETIDPYYKEIAYKLYRNLKHDVSLQDISLLHLLSHHPGSRSNLFRIFKMVIGVSPNTVRRDHRIIHFKKKLLTTHTPIHSLFMDSGFKSRSHLYNLFQDIYGMSPKEFRRKYGKLS